MRPPRKREAPPRRCASCPLPILPGQTTTYLDGLGLVHAYCAEQFTADPEDPTP